MHHSFKRLALFSVVISFCLHQLSAATSEIFTEIMGFYQAIGIEKPSISFPDAIKVPKDIPTETKTQISEFIEDKTKAIPPHDFFSVDRSCGLEPSDAQVKQLIENWVLWYFCKSLEVELGSFNARRELEITLASKIEFYEQIAFMTTDPELGLRTKAFYKKQLEAINQLPIE